jgi:hypothetical protein
MASHFSCFHLRLPSIEDSDLDRRIGTSIQLLSQSTSTGDRKWRRRSEAAMPHAAIKAESDTDILDWIQKSHDNGNLGTRAEMVGPFILRHGGELFTMKSMPDKELHLQIRSEQ